jgi:hypothetical protein
MQRGIGRNWFVAVGVSNPESHSWRLEEYLNPNEGLPSAFESKIRLVGQASNTWPGSLQRSLIWRGIIEWLERGKGSMTHADI